MSGRSIPRISNIFCSDYYGQFLTYFVIFRSYDIRNAVNCMLADGLCSSFSNEDERHIAGQNLEIILDNYCKKS